MSRTPTVLTQKLTCGKLTCGHEGRFLFDDLDQLDVEDQGRLGGDRRGTAAGAIGLSVRDDEFALGTDPHGSNALGPAADDAVEGEGRRLAAVD